MKVTRHQAIKFLKHQINNLKAMIAQGVKAFKSYILDLVDAESRLEELEMQKVELQGSEKQIKWAEEIREKVFSLLDNPGSLALDAAKQEIIKRDGLAVFLLDVESYIQENKEKFHKLGEDKAKKSISQMRTLAADLEIEAKQLSTSCLAKLENPKYQLGLSRLQTLNTLSDASAWIEFFRDIEVSWNGYLKVVIALRGDYFKQ